MTNGKACKTANCKRNENQPFLGEIKTQWRQNKLSFYISRQLQRHKTMKLSPQSIDSLLVTHI